MNAMTMVVIFQRSFELLTRNPVVVVPGLIGGLVNDVFHRLYFPPVAIGGTGIFPGVMHVVNGFMAYAAIAGAITLVTFAATTSIAATAWEGRLGSFEDGMRVFRESGNGLYVTLLQMAGIMAIAVILGIPTGALSIIAAFYFLVYAVASAVVGGNPGFQAIRESITIATRRVPQTAGIVIVFLLLALCSAIFGQLLYLLPIIGSLLVVLLNQVVLAYITLVIVGEYINARRMEPPPSI